MVRVRIFLVDCLEVLQTVMNGVFGHRFVAVLNPATLFIMTLENETIKMPILGFVL